MSDWNNYRHHHCMTPGLATGYLFKYAISLCCKQFEHWREASANAVATINANARPAGYPFSKQVSLNTNLLWADIHDLLPRAEGTTTTSDRPSEMRVPLVTTVNDRQTRFPNQDEVGVAAETGTGIGMRTRTIVSVTEVEVKMVATARRKSKSIVGGIVSIILTVNYYQAEER